MSLLTGSEDVGLVRGELLYLVLGFDTQLACHLVAVVGIHIGVELLVIPCDRAADGRGVGDEAACGRWGLAGVGRGDP